VLWVFLHHIDTAYKCRLKRFFAIRPSFPLKGINGIRIAPNFSESNLEKNGSGYYSMRATVMERSEVISPINQEEF
jgi:hypothetical protein